MLLLHNSLSSESAWLTLLPGVLLVNGFSTDDKILNTSLLMIFCPLCFGNRAGEGCFDKKTSNH